MVHDFELPSTCSQEVFAGDPQCFRQHRGEWQARPVAAIDGMHQLEYDVR